MPFNEKTRGLLKFHVSFLFRIFDTLSYFKYSISYIKQSFGLVNYEMDQKVYGDILNYSRCETREYPRV